MDGRCPVLARAVRSPTEPEQLCAIRTGWASCCKHPKKLLTKADPTQRAEFVRTDGRALTDAADASASINFVDETHVRADAELTSLWVPKGEPALVASTSPRRAEQVGYYSAICLETGRVDVMRLDSTSRAATSVAFLQQLRATYSGPPIVIWDNAPAHRGEELRLYLAPPDLRLRLVALPADCPDDNADEAIWTWARTEVTATPCWGTDERARADLARFFDGLPARADEAKRRCRPRLQSDLAVLRETAVTMEHGHLTCASV